MLDQDRPNDAHLYYLSEDLSLNKATLWSFLGDRTSSCFFQGTSLQPALPGYCLTESIYTWEMWKGGTK